MSKKDDFTDFRAQLKKLKQEKASKNSWDQDDENAQGAIERVKSAMMPVIKAFVDTDHNLEIQSDEFRAIYISYANTRTATSFTSYNYIAHNCPLI
ncbi:hypothetical protein NZD89_05310 [Alicyclobacillus fastidiosus]|uniref:EF-hand domain-containing protein n=1 Tax=Alicyclobacillus fastidiosus TaxID=392011 RepID=A0ABY6ZIU0_9BACL|nr:hypothetical protein [Alicyclobacillus fastidiosus]WAH42848.1 hypothetical protein NZD89_05310 [Alicyclobacillus fastidiosus]GMA64783.1 hypothetical protein GCM10025859_52230 [Alicyclobacillus fastidiosus]